MKTSNVLAAAVALQEFTVAEVAAYSDASRAEILRVLAGAEGLVERVGSMPADNRTTSGPGEQEAQGGTAVERWRVIDATQVRELISRHAVATGASAQPTVPPATGRPQSLRLLRAEETLFECADQPSRQMRSVMAATAMNYLRQYVAAATAKQNWWEVELQAESCDSPRERPQDGTLNGPRLWVDVALANLTESEALGKEVTWDFLIRTATEVCDLGDAIDLPRLREVVDRFVGLAGDLTRLSVDDVPRAPAPARLLSALAWRRVRAQVEPDVETAAHQAVSVLRWLEDRPPTARAGCCGLFYFGDHLPDGWNRITVYSDLLRILPSQYGWRPQDELVPGVLLEAVADSRAASELQGYADAMEANLVHAPWGSDSALIGIAAQVFDDLAAGSAQLDAGVLSRCVQTKTELLSLADVRTRPPTGALPTSPPPCTKTDPGRVG